MRKKNIVVFILLLVVISALLIAGFRLGSILKKEAPGVAARKILYYRNPMNPQVTSPVPIKDQMGMEYTPVYEEEQGSAMKEGSGLRISPEQQQMLGIQTEKIQKRILTQQILATGRIAYDPDLYIAQEEFLQTLKTVNDTKNSALTSVSKQSNALLEASRKKLMLLGMSKEQIEGLARQGIAQENLYLPASADTVWVYITIYEQDLGLIKEGMPVEIEAVAFPGEVFNGKIIAITPVLDASTRAVQVRAEIENPGHKFKPEMYVNCKINIELGEKLAVSEEAVMDTGERRIVFVAKPNGYFEQREVKLGNKAKGYYEIISDLNGGEEVVASGNFFVDSESRLKPNK